MSRARSSNSTATPKGIDQAEQDREQEPAGHRLGDAEIAQEADGVVQALADEQHQDADGDGEKGVDPQDAVDKLHDCPLWLGLDRAPLAERAWYHPEYPSQSNP